MSTEGATLRSARHEAPRAAVCARGAAVRLCQSRPLSRLSTPRSNHHFGAIIFAALVAARLLAEVPAAHAEAIEATEVAEVAEAGRPGALARPESMWSILSRYVAAADRQ